jgi:hypothetical protein
MEIIHFNTQKDWRGGERQLAWLMDELAKKGIKQTLFCRKNSKLESYAIDQNIPYHSFRYNCIAYFLFRINCTRSLAVKKT